VPKITGIYKVTSPTGKVYIGQSTDISRRFYLYSTLRCKRQKFLFNSLVEHGASNHSFDIIHQLPHDVDQKTLNDYEILYWELYTDCDIKMMNIRYPGSNGSHDSKTLKSIARKNSIAIVQISTVGKVIKHWDGIREATRSLNISSASIYQSCSNRSKTGGGFIWLYKKDFNLIDDIKKHCSDRMIEREINSKKGHINIQNDRSISVLMLSNTGEILQEWKSAVDAGKYLGIHPSQITACCKKKRYTTKGRIFIYKHSLYHIEDLKSYCNNILKQKNSNMMERIEKLAVIHRTKK